MSRGKYHLSDTLRSRGFVIGLHAGLWLLLALVIVGSGFSRHFPPYRESSTNAAIATAPVPVAQLEALFTPAKATELVVASQLDLFATTYFVPRTPPPAAPTKPAPPPPPTTWKVELTYHGFYRSGDGPKNALLRVGDKLVSIPVGSMVVTNLFIVDAVTPRLTLTNTAVQTNVLPLNVKQTIEVPLK
ncbi:MAG TPA: hypothetical protein VFZ59_05875 [Verrucomicrobiae bacterium]|nr:hypothetical protein [Verrucomicrobiae bacterium]